MLRFPEKLSVVGKFDVRVDNVTLEVADCQRFGEVSLFNVPLNSAAQQGARPLPSRKSLSSSPSKSHSKRQTGAHQTDHIDHKAEEPPLLLYSDRKSSSRTSRSRTSKHGKGNPNHRTPFPAFSPAARNRSTRRSRASTSSSGFRGPDSSASSSPSPAPFEKLPSSSGMVVKKTSSRRSTSGSGRRAAAAQRKSTTSTPEMLVASSSTSSSVSRHRSPSRATKSLQNLSRHGSRSSLKSAASPVSTRKRSSKKSSTAMPSSTESPSSTRDRSGSLLIETTDGFLSSYTLPGRPRSSSRSSSRRDTYPPARQEEDVDIEAPVVSKQSSVKGQHPVVSKKSSSSSANRKTVSGRSSDASLGTRRTSSRKSRETSITSSSPKKREADNVVTHTRTSSRTSSRSRGSSRRRSRISGTRSSGRTGSHEPASRASGAGGQSLQAQPAAGPTSSLSTKKSMKMSKTVSFGGQKRASSRSSSSRGPSKGDLHQDEPSRTASGVVLKKVSSLRSAKSRTASRTSAVVAPSRAASAAARTPSRQSWKSSHSKNFSTPPIQRGQSGHYSDESDCESYYTDEEEEEEEWSYYTASESENEDERGQEQFQFGRDESSRSWTETTAELMNPPAAAVTSSNSISGPRSSRAATRQSSSARRRPSSTSSSTVSPKSTTSRLRDEAVFDQFDETGKQMAQLREQDQHDAATPVRTPIELARSNSRAAASLSSPTDLLQGAAGATSASGSTSVPAPVEFKVTVPYAERYLWQDNVKFAWSRSGKPYMWSLENADKLAHRFGAVMRTLAEFPGAKMWRLVKLATIGGGGEGGVEETYEELQLAQPTSGPSTADVLVRPAAVPRQEVEAFWRDRMYKRKQTMQFTFVPVCSSGPTGTETPDAGAALEDHQKQDQQQAARRLKSFHKTIPLVNDFSNLYLQYDKYGARIAGFAPNYPVGWRDIFVGDRVVEINGVSVVNRCREFIEQLIQEDDAEVVVQIRRKADGSLTDRIPFLQYKGSTDRDINSTMMKMSQRQLRRGGQAAAPPPRGGIIYGGVESMVLAEENEKQKHMKPTKSKSSCTSKRNNLVSTTSRSSFLPASRKSHESMQPSDSVAGKLRFKAGYGPVHNPKIPVYEQYEMPSGIFG